MLTQLRFFVVVAEECHFGRAADRLGIAQPPLSQRVRRLERHLGVELFDRGRRQVRLTEAGQVLLAESRDLLARWDRTRTLVAKAHGGELDALRAGVPPELPGRVLAAMHTRFAAACPGVRLELRELATAEQVRLLGERELDIGLLRHPVDVIGLDLGPIIDTPLGVVLPRDHRLAARAELALADLAGEGLVSAPRDAAPGVYDAVLRICWEHGFRPKTVAHARNPEFVLGMVLAGHGVAFDQGTVARKESRVAWRPLTGDPLRTRMSFAWPSTTPHPQAEPLATIAATVLRAEDAAPEADTPGDTPTGFRWDAVYRD